MSNKVIEYSLFVAALILAGFGIFCLAMTASATGRIDYCYVDNISGATGGYEVIGHRAWRPDAHLGVAGSPQAANDVLLNSTICPK